MMIVAICVYFYFVTGLAVMGTVTAFFDREYEWELKEFLILSSVWPICLFAFALESIRERGGILKLSRKVFGGKG